MIELNKSKWLTDGLYTVAIMSGLTIIAGLIFAIFSGGECAEVCSVGICERSLGTCFSNPSIAVATPIFFIFSFLTHHINPIVLIPLTIAFYFILGAIIGIFIRTLGGVFKRD